MSTRRSPRQWLRANLGGVAAAPVVALAGLNLLDELDQAAYGLFGPDIVRDFGITPTVFGLATLPMIALGIVLPVIAGWLTDRMNRIHLSVIGGALWFCFAIATGLVGLFWVLVLVRIGTVVGRSVTQPTHNTLLSDYYPVEGRGTAFSIHQNANPLGSVLGLTLGGWIANELGWRAAFLILPLPGLLALVAIMRLKEPVRGAYERLAAKGAFNDAPPPKLAQSIALLRNIKSWRRYAWVWLLLAIGLAVSSLLSFYYEAIFGLGLFGRGLLLGAVALLGAAGAIYGGVLSQRYMANGQLQRMGNLITLASVATAVAFVGMAFAPNMWVATFIVLFTSPPRAIAVVPVMLILSATVPARIRGQGFGVLGLYFSVGLLGQPIALALGDAWGYRWAMLLGVVPMLLAGLLAWFAARDISGDVERANRVGAAEMAIRERRAAGDRIDMLEVAGLNVAYGDVQVLFDVDLRVAEGETVALLGTNGAGKSTLLRAVSGLVKPRDGIVMFDGEDITGLDAEETTARGIIHVPGGRGVFPGLTVARNLRMGTYLQAKDKAYRQQALEEALELFPRLGDRMQQRAGSLSGGEQQMLTLAQAFMARPKVIAIDELSLGLAPKVVQDLLEVVADINARGVAIIVVEQSLNIALDLADRAYFMEKGEIRFEGSSAELRERGDIVRSVFLAGAAEPTP